MRIHQLIMYDFEEREIFLLMGNEGFATMGPILYFDVPESCDGGGVTDSEYYVDLSTPLNGLIRSVSIM